MTQCYKCQKDITLENQSEEHIFPNSCGGRLKSKDLLCKPCNESFGKDEDATFASQVNPLMNLLSIKRERGKTQSVPFRGLVSGQEFILPNSGDIELKKPTIEEGKVNSEGKIPVHVVCRTTTEARCIMRKYPEIDVERELASAIRTRHTLGETARFDMPFGGGAFFKAIVKIAINFFIYKGGERKYIERALHFFDNTDDNIIALYYPSNNIYTPSENEISHLIRVVGNPAEKILYAYIELFNVLCFMVRLSDNYEGEFTDNTYIYDLLMNQEINREIEFYYSKQQVLDLTESRDITECMADQLQQRLNKLAPCIVERQIEKIIREVVSKTLGKIPEGEVISEQHINKLIGELTPLTEYFAILRCHVADEAS